MPDIFQEAIDFHREKLNLPTKTWDQILGETHAKAFTVAGATRIELLEDLRGAVTKAIEDGESISQFRNRFDDIVAKHGWSYKGQRRWRTRVIYDTNLRTSHLAGRWKQIQRVKERRPFMQYQTAGDGRVRPLHAAWDDIILPVDHPWWDTHYPPNGWGCRCTIRSLSQSQLDRMGREVDSAPRTTTSERVITRTGEIVGQVPDGIDTGWDYHVGKAWLGPDIALGEAMAGLPPLAQSTAIAAATQITLGDKKGFKKWVKDVLSRDRNLGEVRPVGWLHPQAISFLESKGIKPKNTLITVEDSRLRRMRRKSKSDRGASLPEVDLENMVDHLADPEAIVWDNENETLLYVFTPAVPNKKGKLVIRVDFVGKRQQRFNAVQSGGVVGKRNLLNQKQHTHIFGEI